MAAATQGRAEKVSALVRDDAVHASVYADPEIFEWEMEYLFGRAWLLVGHVSQMPRPHDYVTSRAGRVPIVLVRGADGTVRAFHNVCPHRGARLCAPPAGRAETIVCPYHGWTFDGTGALLSVPLPDELPASFDRARHGLRPVGRCRTYRGFVFASLAAQGPDLVDFLGHMRTSIDDLVDRAPADSVTVAGALVRHRYRANWKLSFENLNDTLHAGVAHGAAVRAARRVSASGRAEDADPILRMMMANGKPLSSFQALDLVTEQGGHSYFGGHMGLDYAAQARGPYFAALSAAKGEARAREILATDRHLTLLYPSSTWHGRYQTVRMIRPLAPDLTEVVAMAFRLDGAPAATFDSVIDYCGQSSSPLSSVITDDLELYETIQRQAARAPGWLNIARGAGDRAANRRPATSEAFIRNQYRAWAAALAAA